MQNENTKNVDEQKEWNTILMADIRDLQQKTRELALDNQCY
jgi:hypothetical protein